VSPGNDDPLVDSKAEGILERERPLRPSHGVEGGDDASQVDIPQDEGLIETLIQTGQARDLGRSPSFLSTVNEEVRIPGAMITLDLLNEGKIIKTEPGKLAGNQAPRTIQEEVTIGKSTRFTGCFIVKGHFQALRDQERLQELRDCEPYLNQDPRFREVTNQVRSLEPGPERYKAVKDFWTTAYSKYQRSERELLRRRGKVLSEYIGLLDEERLRRTLCERASGPSHVEDGGGDAQHSVIRLHRSSTGTEGPSSRDNRRYLAWTKPK
jgi:hypothetical protein